MVRTKAGAAIVASTMMVASSASAKPPVQPPEPPSHPSWADVRAKGQALVVGNLFDPGSAQIVYTSGFRWGYFKPLIGRRTFAWIACATINAKNRMGGYVGAAPFWIAVDQAGTVTTGAVADTMSSCDEGGVPLQPELQEGYGTTPTNAGNGAVSVADELGKLADLKAKGIITEDEFQRQKAKLLAR